MTSEATEPAEPLAEAVARRVRGLMGEKRIRQAELALRLGVSQAAMSRRLTGEMYFGLNEIPAVADALGTTEAYLLGYGQSGAGLGVPIGMSQTARDDSVTPTPGYITNLADHRRPDVPAAPRRAAWGDVLPFRRAARRTSARWSA